MKKRTLIKEYEEGVTMQISPYDEVNIVASVQVYKVERSFLGFKFKPGYKIEVHAPYIRWPSHECERCSNKRLRMLVDEMKYKAKTFIEHQKYGEESK